MLVIDKDQVLALLTFQDCISQMHLALSDLSEEKVETPVRRKYDFGASNGTLFVMPASSKGLGAYGAKLITQHPENPRGGLPAIQGYVILFDFETGAPVGLVEASAITYLRTAATSALATNVLARENASTHGILGTGVQASAHLHAIPCIREICETRVWARDFDSAESFVNTHQDNTSSKLVAVRTAEEAAKSDIISCTTASTQPIIFGKWPDPGAHVNLVGSHTPDARESDSDLICQSTVFVDSRSAASEEAGDLIIPFAEGVAPGIESYGELGELLSGNISGRESNQQITVFKSVGVAAMDLFAAKLVVDRALAGDVDCPAGTNAASDKAGLG